MSVALSLWDGGAVRASIANSSGAKGVTPDGLAWQREMERAQMQGWLDHGLANQARRAPDLGENLSTQVPEKAIPLLSISSLSTRLALGGGGSTSAVARAGDPMYADTSVHVTLNSDDSLQLVAAAIEQKLSMSGEGEGAASVSGSIDQDATVRIGGQVSSGKSMSLPRITLERAGVGMRVWLGVDAHDGIPLDMMRTVLRAIGEVLEASGFALDSIIYNGQPIALSLMEGYARTADFQSYFDFPQEM